MQETKVNETSEVEVLRSTSLTGTEVPQRVLLAPWGQVESSNGSFVVDEESARLAIEAFDEHSTDLPIDYEHQTLGGTYASPSGRAPAAGWIKKLFAESGVGLVAHIEWTEEAKSVLSAKEYRYLSPVAIIRKTDRKLVALHSAALTNKPAIVGMQPIVNRVELGDDDPAEPLALLKAELSLPDEADPCEVLTLAGRRLADLRRESKQQHIEKRIAEAMVVGKLVEAQRSWAEALVAREEELFDEWLRVAPVVVTPGATRPPDQSKTDTAGQTARAVRARSEFRMNPLLARLTTEDAYLALAQREN